MEEVAVTTTFPFVESPEVFMSKSRSLRADGVASSEEEEEEAECIESPEIEFSLGECTYRASRRGGSRGINRTVTPAIAIQRREGRE